MRSVAPRNEPDVPAKAQFDTTRWSIVVSAAQRSSPESQAALETLCRAYWHPLYAYARRRGYSFEDASDLTQEFFARLLEKGSLLQADRAKGKFRSFLLASLKHFLANQWDKASAQRRGGGRTVVSIDATAADTWYGLQPAHDLTAEKIFERRWALTLLENVLLRLRAEYLSSDKGDLFKALKSAIVEPGEAAAYRDLGSKLGMSEGAVKVAVHRLRKRYRDLLVDEIAHTVASRADVEEELQTLLTAVGG
jgi:RNA polymerase sigma-70 factor (ECF subfamily)